MELHKDSATRQDEHLRQALTISERSRARALVDLITESSAGGNDSSVDHETRRLYQQMAEARYRLDNVIESQAGNATGPGSSIAEVQQELATIENELNLTLIKQRESNPTLSRLTDPQILSAHQIQDLLSPGTSLLHYDLGAERSYVWQVTHDSIQAWSLPARSEIEESARALYGLLQAPAHAGPHREALAAGIQQISSQLLDPMGQLTANRLVVVADGALQYLPYSLLLAPDSDSSLIASHEIIYLPSASVLAAQRTNTRPV
jgi:hypothetical protein